jgi:hypothetical protein
MRNAKALPHRTDLNGQFASNAGIADVPGTRALIGLDQGNLMFEK